MNGYRMQVVFGLWTVLVAGGLSGATGFAAVVPSGVGQTGVRGQALVGGAVNFQELAGKQALAGGRVGGLTSSRAGQVQQRKGARANRSNGGHVFPAAPLPSAAPEPLLTAASVPASPPASASFLAVVDNAVSFNPDTQGAVGPGHLMATLGSEVRIQNRSGGVISTVSLDGFWGSLGKSNVFDPRVIYDRTNQRWITVAVSNPAASNSLVLIAISQSSDPTGDWYRHGVKVDDIGGGIIDGIYAAAPSIGLSRDWITIQANMLDQTSLNYFSSDFFTFNKTNMYAGGSAAYRRFFHFPDPGKIQAGMTQEAATPVPMVSFDDSYPTNFMVANAGVLGGLGRLRLMSISGPVDNPFYNDYDQVLYVGAGAVFGSPTWESLSPGNDNFAPQAGTTNKIYVGDARIQNVVYRNGALWATHHVFLPAVAPNRVSVQWWSISPGSLVLQHGRMDDPSGAKMYAFPSIAVNRYEDVLIGYSRFALNQYPSANYAFHGYQDGPGRLQSDMVLKAGEAKFTVADNDLTLWGEWSATVVDPLNDTDLWTIQEYASSPVAASERWGTWWGRVAPPTALGLQATATTGLVIAGSPITYTIQVTNFSSHISTGARIINTLPAGATFVSATTSQGSCAQINGIVTCTLGDVRGEVFTNVLVTATIVAQLNLAGTATNLVTVSGYSPDESPSDNSATLLTTVSTAADLALTLAATSNPVIVSNNVTYLVTITNRGPSAAAACFLTNLLPPAVTFLSASTSQGSLTTASGRTTGNLGSLPPGAGLAVTILARVTLAGPQTNLAVVTSSTLDPVLTNNSAVAITIGNSLPTLQAISSRTINEDTVLGPLAFTIGDAETPLDNLVLNALSSNPGVVPPANIVFTGSGANRFMTVTPAPNASGAITITRTLTDTDGSVASNSFVLTILAVNDAPVISSFLPQFINEDTALGPLPFTVGDVETAATALTISGASSNPALIPNANIVLGGTGSNRTVRLLPATNQSGTTTITLTVNDGTLTANGTFLVTVNAVNDLPTISDVGNRTINEDASTPATPFTIGDVETPVGTLVVTVASSNPVLVPVANIVVTGTGASRSVIVTPASNQFGAATITLSVMDTNNATASDTFVLTVTPVNDAPTLDLLPPLAVFEDAGPQIVRLTGLSTGAANETNALTITVTSSNPGLIPNPGTIIHSGAAVTNSFIFTPTANSNGTTTLTVLVNDGASSNNTVLRSFVVTVTPVNDAPTISALADRVINEDGTTGNISLVVGDVESAAVSLIVFAASSDTNLVPVSSIVFGGNGANRFVTVTPAPDRFGTATISVFVRDASATNVASFLLTVNSVNDLPVISSITNRTVNEDTATNISFTIGDKETAAGGLFVSANSSNPSLVSSFSFGGSGSNRTINLLPATNQSGSANITVTVVDADAGSNSTTFAFSVLPVNDLPTLDAIPDVTIDEDSPLQRIVLTGITTGAPDEVQPLSVVVVVGGGLLTNVVVSYSSGESTGRVEFRPVTDANGTAVMTVRVSDGVSTNSRSFTVTVLPVNDLPTISQLNTIDIDEDTTAVVPVTVSDLETPAAGLVVQVQSSNPEVLDETGIVIEGTGTNRVIRLTPISDVFGDNTIVSVTVVDGDNGFATTTFTLNVRSVNDAPTISGATEVAVDEDSAANLVSFVVADDDTPSSSLLVTATTHNATLLPQESIVLGGSDGNRTLSLTPAPNEFGTTTVSIVVRESSDAGALAATNVLTVIVLALNDPPTLDTIQSMVIPSGSAMQVVNLSGIGMGASNEGQTLTVTALSSDVAVIAHPSISYTSPGTSGTLSFTPNPGATGTVSITVSVTESGGVPTGGTNQFSRSFAVKVSGPGPSLLVEQLEGMAIVSWSTNSSITWHLESTTNVSEGGSWVISSATQVVANGRFIVTNQIDGVTRFYRLRNQ